MVSSPWAVEKLVVPPVELIDCSFASLVVEVKCSSLVSEDWVDITGMLVFCLYFVLV